ncbi:MAG: tetratricopeptide repeat protein [Chloroflexota bacterium]
MNDLLYEAYRYYQQGDKKKASSLLSKVVEEQPDNVSAWFGLALCVEQDEQKIYCLNRILLIDPQHEKARNMLKALIERSPHFEQTKSENQVKKTVGSQAQNQKATLRSKGSWVKIFMVAGLFLVTLFLLTSIIMIASMVNENRRATATSVAATAEFRTTSAAATAEFNKCSEQFQDEMLQLLSKFFRQQNIAETTARIALPQQISRLEDIRNQAWEMPSKVCQPTTHSLLMDYMDKVIESYIAFSGEQDLDSLELLSESLKALIKLDEHVSKKYNPYGLVAMFRAKGYYYWERLDDPNWKEGFSG